MLRPPRSPLFAFRHYLRLQGRRCQSTTPPPPRPNTNTPPPPPGTYSSTTKIIYGASVLGGYLFGVQQGVFLDIRELPALVQRIYGKTLGDEKATENITSGSSTASHPTMTRHDAEITDTVFLDVAIGPEAPSRRIELGLYHDATPKTCENFETLCTNISEEVVVGKKDHVLSGRIQNFVQSPFHRIIPKFVVQGGDWTKGNGKGTKKINLIL